MKADRQSALFHVLKWNPGQHRPSTRVSLDADNFKVSRTYSLVGSLSRHAAAGTKIKNQVFSDQGGGADLSFQVRHTTAEEPVPWRVGYYDKPRSWEETGPLPGQTNSLTHRFADQKQFVSEKMPTSKPSFLERCSAKALSLRKATAKKRRKLAQLRGEDAASSSSTSSSDSDSSADSS